MKKETTFPLSAFGVIERYLKPWAYNFSGSSVQVKRCHVGFIREKMKEHGNPYFPVKPTI